MSILKFFGYPINKAIGSAAAIGFVIALFGLLFFISGTYLNIITFKLGFINIPALIIFVPITTFMARLGKNKSQNREKLTKYFGYF